MALCDGSDDDHLRLEQPAERVSYRGGCRRPLRDLRDGCPDDEAGPLEDTQCKCGQARIEHDCADAYWIFLDRPVSATLVVVNAALLAAMVYLTIKRIRGTKETELAKAMSADE